MFASGCILGCKIKRGLCSGCSFVPSRGRYRFIMYPLAPSFPVAVYFCTLYQNLSTERARQQLETCKQESETEEAKLHHLESQYKSIASWAQEFDSAPIDTKKMILARIIQKITVDRNYHIVIRFFVSIDDFESTINVRDSDIHVEQTGSFIETIA